MNDGYHLHLISNENPLHFIARNTLTQRERETHYCVPRTGVGLLVITKNGIPSHDKYRPNDSLIKITTIFS